MGLCSSVCSDFELVSNPQAGCDTTLRQTTLSRVAFYSCSTSLPSPITNTAIKALFDDGSIVVSSPLGNIQLGDPTTEDINIDECSPAQSVVTGRELTAEDRVAVSSTSGSPAVVNEYHDYGFWDDKVIRQGSMRYMLIFCNGDVVIPKDRSGNPLTASVSSTLKYQKPQQQGGSWIEYKALVFRFQGDPLALFTAKPAFNLNTAGITL